MFKRNLGILAVTALVGLSCGEKDSLTGPPLETSLLVQVTLSPTDPPAGVKHAALATFHVTARQRDVALEGVQAYDDLGTAHVVVSGFVPLRVPAHQSTAFDVTLSSNDDIPCYYDSLSVLLTFDDGQKKGSAGASFYCNRTERWLF